MIYLTFLGEKRSEEVRKAHIHEPGVMKVPLLILASLCFITGFLEGPFAGFFGVGGHNGGLPFHIDPLGVTLSVIALIVGIVPVYAVYWRRSPPPENFAKGGWGFLQRMISEGYYFDKAYYAVFVDGLTAAVRGFRKTHCGILNFNMSLIIGGIIVMTLMLLAMGGA